MLCKTLMMTTLKKRSFLGRALKSNLDLQRGTSSLGNLIHFFKTNILRMYFGLLRLRYFRITGKITKKKTTENSQKNDMEFHVFPAFDPLPNYIEYEIEIQKEIQFAIIMNMF